MFLKGQTNCMLECYCYVFSNGLDCLQMFLSKVYHLHEEMRSSYILAFLQSFLDDKKVVGYSILMILGVLWSICQEMLVSCELYLGLRE